MAHTHQHRGPDFGWAFALAAALNIAYVVIEASAGWWVGSLALVADAGHNLGDVLGLLMAWLATWLARSRPTQRRTYGLGRSSIIAALANAALLLATVGGVTWEAVRRFYQPEAVPGWPVAWVALIGVAVNTATALLFLRGGKRDVNIRGAFLHMAADAGVSLGVVIAGAVMQFTGWTWLDPALSLAIAVVILIGTWDTLREALDLALDAVPRDIDPQAIGAYLNSLPGVTHLHDLHIWGMSTTEAALTVHLVIPQGTNDDELLRQVGRELHDKFEIVHATVQVERGTNGVCPCGVRCDAPV